MATSIIVAMRIHRVKPEHHGVVRFHRLGCEGPREHADVATSQEVPCMERNAMRQPHLVEVQADGPGLLSGVEENHCKGASLHRHSPDLQVGILRVVVHLITSSANKETTQHSNRRSAPDDSSSSSIAAMAELFSSIRLKCTRADVLLLHSLHNTSTTHNPSIGRVAVSEGASRGADDDGDLVSLLCWAHHSALDSKWVLTKDIIITKE